MKSGDGPIPAKAWLQDRRQKANWSRLLISPIRLRDGSVLFTLGDAAKRVLALPPTPSSRVAAARIIEAATLHGDMASTQAALRLALLKGRLGQADAENKSPTAADDRA